MKKDVFWNSLGISAWSFLSLFLLIIVTRINGITESGLFSFSFAFAIIIFTVCCFGGRAYQVSDHKASFSTDSYISSRIFTSFIALILTILFVILNRYDLEKAALLIILVGHRVFDALADVFYGIMQKKRHLYISGKSMFYKSIISMVMFIVIDLLTKNILLSAMTLPVISLLFILFYDIPQTRQLQNFSITFNLSEIKKILQSTFLPFSIAVMGLIFANLARYFIDIYHPHLQGYFGIIIMPLSLIILVFSFILTPAILHLSDKYNHQEFHDLHKTILTIICTMAAATLLLCIFMYFLGVPLLKLLFGIDFARYIIDIILVVIIGFLLSITSLFTNIAIIARRLRLTAAVYLLSNILLVLLCVVLVKGLQIHGAIITYIIASVVQTGAMGIYYINLTKRQRLSRKL